MRTKGTPAELDARRLVAALKRGAVAAGHDSDLWTCRSVRDLIGKTEGVWHDFNHVGRILPALGFSPQKPRGPGRERDHRVLRRIRLHAAAFGESVVGSARADADPPLRGPA